MSIIKTSLLRMDQTILGIFFSWTYRMTEKPADHAAGGNDPFHFQITGYLE